METNQRPQREIGKHQINPELRKYIRIQIVGMAIFLSWPVAMMMATMYGLDYIIPQISALLIVVALIVFSIGLVGRQELREHNVKGK